ncbi:MAG: hypothetical protein N2544_07990 [Burkholderiales bacterium]|nr:hypothetical protein [Burkholderiales bacterium]
MRPRDAFSPWKLHALATGAVALAATAAGGAYLALRTDGPPAGVVFVATGVGFAIYALLASVFVALLGPAATRRKVVLAHAAALVLAPLATASVLTMRPAKPPAPPRAAAHRPAHSVSPEIATPRPGLAMTEKGAPPRGATQGGGLARQSRRAAATRHGRHREERTRRGDPARSARRRSQAPPATGPAALAAATPPDQGPSRPI